MVRDDLIYELETRMEHAQQRYGEFASTHEAMGVCLEEWDEFREAVRENDQLRIEQECIDLAAVLVRLARTLRNSNYAHERSAK